jgi:hypothetical protein
MAQDRRRCQRILAAVPVVARGVSRNRPFEETTETLNLGERGCLVRMTTPLAQGQQIRIVNAKTSEEIACAVVFLSQVDSAGWINVGLEFAQPSPRFWQAVFPCKD